MARRSILHEAPTKLRTRAERLGLSAEMIAACCGIAREKAEAILGGLEDNVADMKRHAAQTAGLVERACTKDRAHA